MCVVIFGSNSLKVLMRAMKKLLLFGSEYLRKSVFFDNLSSWLIWTLKMCVVLFGGNSLKFTALKNVLTTVLY